MRVQVVVKFWIWQSVYPVFYQLGDGLVFACCIGADFIQSTLTNSYVQSFCFHSNNVYTTSKHYANIRMVEDPPS